MSLPTIPGLTAADLASADAILRREIGEFRHSAKVYGRCVGIKRKDGKPIDRVHEIWAGSICHIAEGWTVHHDTTWIRFKTSGQMAADDEASELDTAFPPVNIVPPTYEIPVTDNPILAAEVIHKAGRRLKPLKGALAVVLATVKELAPSSAIAIDTVVARAVERQPKKLDVRGVDRRRELTNRAVTRLVELKRLFVHGDDQELVSLTRVEEVDE